MSKSRDMMIAELKRVVVPVLRELGFSGSFPHFRRASNARIDLLTFQFSSWGGQFVVEIGKFPPDGYRTRTEIVPPDKVRMRHLLLNRRRIGAKDGKSDHWFNFDDGNYSDVAASVLPHVTGQAVDWWEKPGFERRGE